MAEDQTAAPADASVPEADPEKTALQAQVAELQAALEDATSKLAASDNSLKAAKNGWKSDVKELKAKLKASEDKDAGLPLCDGNHVFIDGGKYDIIWRSTVRDLAVEGYQKRNVHEDQTAVVIVKSGG
jgi:hypothetical protein